LDRLALRLEDAEPALLPAVLLLGFVLAVESGGSAILWRWESALFLAFLGLGHTLRRPREGGPLAPVWGDFFTLSAMAPHFILVADGSRRAADGRLDLWLAAVDTELLGTTAALWFRGQFPAPWIHEWFAFAYVAYYLFIPAGPLLAWRRGPRWRRRAVLAVGLAYAVATVLELLFPTAGPLAQRAATVLDSGAMKDLVDTIYKLDATGGAAFPSSHVAVGTVGWWIIQQHSRPLGLLTLPLILNLWVSTVQGSFHYTLDVPAGVLVTVLILVTVRPGSVEAPA
jgi:hypothetical protein